MKMFGKIDRLENTALHHVRTGLLSPRNCLEVTSAHGPAGVADACRLFEQSADASRRLYLRGRPSPVPPMGMSNLSVKIRKLLRGYRAPTRWQRDRGTKDVVGVVHLFDRGQAFDVGTKALR